MRKQSWLRIVQLHLLFLCSRHGTRPKPPDHNHHLATPKRSLLDGGGGRGDKRKWCVAVNSAGGRLWTSSIKSERILKPPSLCTWISLRLALSLPLNSVPPVERKSLDVPRHGSRERRVLTTTQPRWGRDKGNMRGLQPPLASVAGPEIATCPLAVTVTVKGCETPLGVIGFCDVYAPWCMYKMICTFLCFVSAYDFIRFLQAHLYLDIKKLEPLK